MRRSLFLFGLVLSALLIAACGGDDDGGEGGGEVEQLRADVDALQSEVNVLRAAQEEAETERGEIFGEVEAVLDEVLGSVEAAEAVEALLQPAIDKAAGEIVAISQRLEAGEAGALERIQALMKLQETVAELGAELNAVVRAPVVGYFLQLEVLAQALEQATEELSDSLGVAIEAEDVPRAKEILQDLSAVQQEFAAGIMALDPPQAIAPAHTEAVEAMQAFVGLVLQLERLIAPVSTIDDFMSVFLAFAEQPGFEQVSDRNDAACEQLQDLAGELQIDIDLSCG
ncbi:MAG: hypothetical protein DK306_001950 [Chloroflexi bacterium]|nr:MAG: hypothetical protein DK306_001950 [Chloroflexota bacterium]